MKADGIRQTQEPGRVYFLTWRTAAGVTLSSDERTIVMNTILYADGKRWAVYAAVVMPNHVHVLIRPLPMCAGVSAPGCDPSELTDLWKHWSAWEFLLRRSEACVVWQDEHYILAVRDHHEQMETWEYIRDNPVKAGLAASPEAYEWFHQRQWAE